LSDETIGFSAVTPFGPGGDKIALESSFCDATRSAAKT
jgi:hypothetical protein